MAEKPKIIVDEDWKTQVQAEKQAQQKQPTQPKPQEAMPKQAVGPLPPANLALLMTTLATQAMVALGEIPNPFTGKAEVELDSAKHLIDMLQMLEDKTQGNRTADETAMLGSLLHQLRLGYVAAQGRPAETRDERATDEGGSGAAT